MSKEPESTTNARSLHAFLDHFGMFDRVFIAFLFLLLCSSVFVGFTGAYCALLTLIMRGFVSKYGHSAIGDIDKMLIMVSIYILGMGLSIYFV